MDILEKIATQVKSDAVVIYMKGTPQFPQCGFSARAISILEKTGLPFKAINVFDDIEVFENLSRYSEWPTFPQIFMGGELIGGGDILLEMAEADELLPAMKEVVENF